MAEVLAVASGIAGLLTLAIETYRISKTCITRVHNASKQAKDMLSELGALKKVLLDLDDLMAGMDEDPVSFVPSIPPRARLLGLLAYTHGSNRIQPGI